MRGTQAEYRTKDKGLTLPSGLAMSNNFSGAQPRVWMTALGGVYIHAELSKAGSEGGGLQEHLKLAGETQEPLHSTTAKQVSMQVTPM